LLRDITRAATTLTESYLREIATKCIAPKLATLLDESLAALKTKLREEIQALPNLVPAAKEAYLNVVESLVVSRDQLLNIVTAVTTQAVDLRQKAVSTWKFVENIEKAWSDRLRTQRALLVDLTTEFQQTKASVDRSLSAIANALKAETTKEISISRTMSAPLSSHLIFKAERRGTPAHLTMDALVTTTVSLDGVSAPQAHLSAVLKDFTLCFPSINTPMLEIGFKQLAITSHNGAISAVPSIGGVRFGGPLDFIATLASALSPSSGPYVNLGYDCSLEAGYRQAIPSLSFGAFTLSGLAISGSATVFLTKPQAAQATLRVSSAASPFIAAVGIWGGGGYFEATFDAKDGITDFRFQVEYGASTAISLAGAEGHACIRGGFYYGKSVSAGRSVAEFRAFVRAEASVRVFSFIDIYCGFYLGISLITSQGQTCAYGVAVVQVRVRIGFFRASATLRYEKIFSGSPSSDPDDKSGITDQHALFHLLSQN